MYTTNQQSGGGGSRRPTPAQQFSQSGDREAVRQAIAAAGGKVNVNALANQLGINAGQVQNVMQNQLPGPGPTGWRPTGRPDMPGVGDAMGLQGLIHPRLLGPPQQLGAGPGVGPMPGAGGPRMLPAEMRPLGNDLMTRTAGVRRRRTNVGYNGGNSYGMGRR